MNDRFELIKLICKSKYKDYNENNMNESIKAWTELEKAIKDKKLRKFRRDDKISLLKYFNDENNKNKFLKIFDKEEIEHFKKENEKFNKKIKENNEEKEEKKEEKKDEEKEEKKDEINKLREILEYYKRYKFESKKDDINKIEKGIENDGVGINKEEYIKDLEEAKKMNDRFNIINYLFNETNKNIEKNENNFNKTADSWFQFEKQINDNKFKKMPKQSKIILLKYFNDINNKEELIKIFGEEKYENFKNESKDKKKEKKEEKKNDYTQLKEVLKYYKEYKFESKKEDIKRIEEIINNNENNYGEYIKDLDEAKKMNDRFNIINYLFNETNIILSI